MQLRKMTWMVAAVGLVLAACGGGNERKDLSCTTDANCIQNEICHPDAKVCVQTCQDSTNCPDSSKTCDAVSSTVTTKVCKCSTTALCQGSTTVSDASTLKCDDTYKVCTSGTAAAKCTSDASCNAGQTCDTTSGQCVTKTEQTTCSAEGQAGCAYGKYCSSSMCTAVTAPTCQNFDPSKGGKTPVFNPSTSTGPIIYSVTEVSYSQDSFCAAAAGGTGLTAKAKVKAYTTGTFPSSKSALSGLFYVKVNGDASTDGTSLIRSTEYSIFDSGKRAEFTMNFCPGESSTQLTIGLYFTNGNETCGVLTK